VREDDVILHAEPDRIFEKRQIDCRRGRIVRIVEQEHLARRATSGGIEARVGKQIRFLFEGQEIRLAAVEDASENRTG